MKIDVKSLCIGRVLNEDDNWLTLEVAKHEDVTFTLQKDENGETVGGDKFLTLLFVRRTDDNGVEVWRPWDG